MCDFIFFIVWSQWLLLRDLCHAFFVGKFDFYKVLQKIVTHLNIQISAHRNNKEILSKETKMILANHRSFTDFFLDAYIAKEAGYLSRLMVIVALPIVGLYGIASGYGIFFNRGKTQRQKLAQKIIFFTKTKKIPIIIYPEGTRQLSLKPIPLKHGALKIAYENKMPCQILLTKNKENVINEKTWTVHKNQRCEYTFSRPINPNDFQTYEKFYEEVTSTWHCLWAELYHTP